MARIPVRFQRVAAAFDADVSRVRLCESSGTEHSPESSTDLSDLVKSFMEKNEGGEEAHVAHIDINNGDKGEDEELEKYEWSDPEKREMLQALFAGSDADQVEEEDRNTKEKIRAEVDELALLGLLGDKSSPGFKRRLMTRLREKGFDAGLCKSKWEKNGRFLAGNYEYVDVYFAGKRYIVEAFLAVEFEIARPTNQYSSLLDVFPAIFVGTVEELKRVVRLMCTAIKGSMKSMDLHVPPWRRNGYMQAKWFSAYRRTTKEVATKKTSISAAMPPYAFSAERFIGFEARPVQSYNCRDDYVKRTGFRVGHLTSALNSDDFGLQL